MWPLRRLRPRPTRSDEGPDLPVRPELYDAANAGIKVAREEGNADIVIALTHLGVDASSEPNRSIDFVKNVPDVDIVIDGHSHTVMTANKDNGMIQSTGTGLAYVGAFVIDNATKSVESNGLIDLSTYTKEDASVKAICRQDHR